jgi:hypothetical protein
MGLVKNVRITVCDMVEPSCLRWQTVINLSIDVETFDLYWNKNFENELNFDEKSSFMPSVDMIWKFKIWAFNKYVYDKWSYFLRF